MNIWQEVASANLSFSTINSDFSVDYTILVVSRWIPPTKKYLMSRQFLWNILQDQSLAFAPQSLSYTCYLAVYVEEN